MNETLEEVNEKMRKRSERDEENLKSNEKFRKKGKIFNEIF